MRILLDTSVETSIQLQGLSSFLWTPKTPLPLLYDVRKFQYQYKVMSDKSSQRSSCVVMVEKSSLRIDVRKTLLRFL